MGIAYTSRVCRSTISFKRAWDGGEETLPYFRGTISCGPSDDTSCKEALDREDMDGDYEGSMDEAGE